MFVVGVDGCRDGWVLVALEDGQFAGASQVASFGEVLAAAEEAAVVAVDMPLGLLERGERACDLVVRAYVGPRRASVFVTPPRPALLQATYDDANAECLRRAGFAMSRQTWGLRPKILEVERALGGHDPELDDAESPASVRASRARHQLRFHDQGPNGHDADGLRRYARVISPARSGAGGVRPERVIEVHPEASFRELAGQALGQGKKSYDGLMHRLSLLESAGIVMPKQLSIGRVAMDDVLDAAAAAWSAHRYAHGRARRFPERDDSQRDGERAIAIWV